MEDHDHSFTEYEWKTTMRRHLYEDADDIERRVREQVRLRQQELARTARKTVTESSQQVIDRELREALEAPRLAAEKAAREAEVARRAELAERIGQNDDYEFGAVLTWNRRFEEDTEFTKAKVYNYAAIKSSDGNWYASGYRASGTSYSFKRLVEELLTGKFIAENLRFVSEWTEIF